jgi:hypothetical protein
MKTELLLLLFTLPVLFAAIQASIASDHGLSYRYWFLLSIPLPLISGIILLWFVYKGKQLKPVENHELFDHLFVAGNENL